MQLRVEAGGVVRCLYDETIDLTALGSLSIRRASHVEPDGDGKWYADLAPVAGPRLGPFLLRSEALEAERAWLVANWLAAPTTPFLCP
jgi:hypothetical protein